MVTVTCFNATSGKPFLWLNMNETQAILTRSAPVHEVKMPRMVTPFFCSIALLILAARNVVVSFRTYVQGILGFVSLLVRSGLCIKTPTGRGVVHA
jgi:hypothetical protein